MGEILEQSICSLQTRLSVSVYPVRFSCPLYLSLSLSLKHYGEKILSLFNMREMGSVSCWTRREERTKPSWLHLTAFAANALCSSFLVQRTQSPTSQWLVPLLPHSLGLNTLLLDLLIPQVQAQHPPPGRAWHQVGVKSRSRTEAWRGPGQRWNPEMGRLGRGEWK